MATITWRSGSVKPLVFRPLEADGSYTPMTGLAMQLRVADGGQCIVLSGAAQTDGFDIDLMPLAGLAPRAYRASEYYNDGNGWRFIGDHTLVIEGGC